MIKWLDVNKKMPDIDEAYVSGNDIDDPWIQCISEAVLVFVPGHGEESGIHTARMWVSTNGKETDAMWMSESTTADEYKGVTHWAKLPEPPSGGDKLD